MTAIDCISKLKQTELPSTKEWNVSALIEDGRSYLADSPRFERIVENVASSVVILPPTLCACQARPPYAAKGTRRLEFRIVVDRETGDLFFNSADGLRSRYWQGPDLGDDATRYLIESLLAALLHSFEVGPVQVFGRAEPMNVEQASACLRARSAKVWVRERDDAGNLMIDLSGAQLFVPRWADIEDCAPQKTSWRWSPTSTEIDIKGAFIEPNGNEYVPNDKLERSLQIHRFGYS